MAGFGITLLYCSFACQISYRLEILHREKLLPLKHAVFGKVEILEMQTLR